MHYQTPQALICDNLLDFSHLSYVHEKTLGGTTAIAQAPAEIEAVPRGIRVTRRVHDVPPPPYYKAIRDIPGNLDRWFIYDFVLPGTLLMHSGGRPIEDEEGDMRRAVRLHSCQTVTPETETTTHYFFQQSRRVEDGDHSVAEALHRSLLVAFEEDRAMITAQAEAIAADPGQPMMLLAMDAAVVRFRRLVADMVSAERMPSLLETRSGGAGAAPRSPVDQFGGEQLRRDGTVERRAR
jgi:vanillate O-demethylase monooxygenase subunit